MSEEMIAPCPFCGQELRKEVRRSTHSDLWWHPSVNDCVLAGRGFRSDQFAAWNTRANSNDKLREALERVAELEAALEAAKPRYAQPCFDHEYITPGCPDCGRLA